MVVEHSLVERHGQPSGPAQSVRGRWSYFALFGMQTIGAVVLIWTGLRLYREVLADPSHEPELGRLSGLCRQSP